MSVEETDAGVEYLRHIPILVRELGISAIKMIPVRMGAITVEWRLHRHVGFWSLLALDGPMGRL